MPIYDEDTDQPRIYVASLAHYNAGELVGKWMDVPATADELWDDINDFISEQTLDGQPVEEWAVHDYEYLTGVSEYPDLEALVAQANLVFEYGEPAREWLDLGWGLGLDPDEWERRFEDQFIGTYDSKEDYVLGFLRSVYDIPEELESYFDTEQYAVVLESGSTTFARGKRGSVYVFDSSL